jgi:protein-S-isoprenylcysteine O-methyltransferase Ste14
MTSNALQFAFVAIILGWLVLGAALLRARLGSASSGPARQRDLGSWLGLGLQGVGFALAFGWRDHAHRPVLALAVAALAWASAWFAVAAVRELGKQWSLTARLLESHELVTSGPFAHVRHPIYSALLGLLVATASVLATPPGAAAAIIVYLLGTHLRATREERLLLGMFGDGYRDYARRVPRLLPRLRAAGRAQSSRR